jgi:predicted metal-dependent HD superfamily phosphohydrolase
MGGGDPELRVAWQRHLGGGDAATRVFESLIDRHRGTGRHYHDVRHVRWVVRHVLDLAEHVGVDDLDAVVAAAFFHDSVYEFDRSDNEARSAELAAATLRDLGWSRDRYERVASMILATQHHADTPAADTDTDTAILLAADLAVLAAEPAAYSDSVGKIRREYAHLDDDEWRAGRGAVINGFLDRVSIFPPQLGLDAWERRARANLTAEAAALR